MKMKKSLLALVAVILLSGCASQRFNQPWKQGFFAVQMACPAESEMSLDNAECRVIGIKRQSADVDISTEGGISPK